MIDLSSYDVKVKKALTQDEYEERRRKGLIKIGEKVDVYGNNGNIESWILIYPPSWEPTIKELQKENWQNKRSIRNIYKYQEELWDYMKENNKIPKDIINEIESEE